jgi:hypothetical protein
VTRVKKNDNSDYNFGSYVILDSGTKYAYSEFTASDVDDVNTGHPTLDVEYRLFLDPNGFVIGFKALESYNENYLYVVDAKSEWSAKPSYQAKVIFSDGTSATVELDTNGIDSSNNSAALSVSSGHVKLNGTNVDGQVFAWTEDDGVYTLRQLREFTTPYVSGYKDAVNDNSTAESGQQIKNKAAYLNISGWDYIVDEDTAFVDVNDKVVYTGFDNVPDYTNGDLRFFAVDSDNDLVLDVVFITAGTASNTSSTYFYLTNVGNFETYNKNKNYKEYNVYVDGEATTLVLDSTAHATVQAAGAGLYKVDKTNSSGIVKNVTFSGSFDYDFKTVVNVGSRSFSVGASSSQEQYTVDSDTLFVVATIDLKTDGSTKDAVVTIGSLSDLKADTDYNTSAVVVKAHSNNKIADLVYVQKVAVNAPAGGGNSSYTVSADTSLVSVSGKTVTLSTTRNITIGDVANALKFKYNGVAVPAAQIKYEKQTLGWATVGNETVAKSDSTTLSSINGLKATIYDVDGTTVKAVFNIAW